MLTAADADKLRVITESINGAVAAFGMRGDGVRALLFASGRRFAMFGYTRERFRAELPDGLGEA